MRKYKFIFVLFIPVFLLLLPSFSPDDKYVRRAMQEMEKGNLKQARFLYEKAIERNPGSYWANLGMGLLLSEMLGNYTGAQPYLQKAFEIADKDTVPPLMYALAKCYQHNGEYEKALTLFDRLGNYRDAEEEIDLEKDIAKRKEDCKYAIDHRDAVQANGWQIINAGKNINSEMPEYVPVLTNDNELIFTSKRRDDKREELCYLDGKYFESMYISRIENNNFQQPRRYTLPDLFLRSRFLRRHESVISISPDGQKLFVFRDNKIHEISMKDKYTRNPKKMLRTINFDFYQNHAFLTKDGNTLYFTSDGKGGQGGIDIYRSSRIKDGEWSKPENLGTTINTPLDEDAPFVSEDGKTLFFASTGHKGFGNYDIFKSEWADGKWSEPVNLGSPVNSPGHDIFYIQSSDGSVGYFSSSRSGGLGDMDIYKINFLDKLGKDCPPFNEPFVSLNVKDEKPGDFANAVELKMPENFKVYSCEWKVNDEIIQGEKTRLEKDYGKAGTYRVNAKYTAYCDTCLSPVVGCLSLEQKFEGGRSEIAVDNGAVAAQGIDVSHLSGELSRQQLKEIGFNTNPVLFDFRKTDVKGEGADILRENAEVLRKYPNLSVEIYGYSDSRGPELLNKLVSEQRCAGIRAFLLYHAVKQGQIKFTMGMGESDLVNDCGKGKTCNEEEHRQNRRVIFKVYAN